MRLQLTVTYLSNPIILCLCRYLPDRQVVEGVLAADIIHDDAGMRPAVVGGCEAAVPLLSCTENVVVTLD